MTDREMYIHSRKETRRYHRKYKRYKDAWKKVTDEITKTMEGRADEVVTGMEMALDIIQKHLEGQEV